MKIGIVTFHAAQNYGAVLQCAALVKKLEGMGHSVYVIDYRPQYLKESVVRNPIQESIHLYKELKGRKPAYRVFRAMRRSIRCVLDWGKIRERMLKEQKFESFRREYLRLTRKYTNIDDLQKDPPVADLYICGSDQLWNTSLTNHALDPVLFLHFGDKSIKRIAYAVSACDVKTEMRDQFAALIKSLDLISIREKKNREYIATVAQKPVLLNPDPTLLLFADAYEQMEEPFEINQPYAFIYLLSKEEAVRQCECLAGKLIETQKLVMVDGSPNKFCKIDQLKCVDNLSPGEWLYLIHHAECVITNSFHCLSFSTIYHKPSYILPCHPSRMERLKEFAESAGLTERMIFSAEDIERAICSKMDYSTITAFENSAKETADSFFVHVFSDLIQRDN